MKSEGKATLVVVGCMLAAFIPSAAAANPVRMNDLVGKTICMDSTPVGPIVATYYSGGKFSNTYWGAGTITATAQGFHIDTEKGSFDGQMEKLPDGTIKSTAFIGGKVYEAIGKFCK